MIELSKLGNSTQQPAKLKSDPILEAVCEFRFAPKNQNAGSLLPGLMYSQLKEDFPELERLAPADLPAPIRQMDPNLRYAHLFRLKGDGHFIAFGDRNITVSVVRPYPGWDSFKALVAKAWETALATDLIGDIERFSVKYINFLPESARNLNDVLRMNVHMGDAELQKEKMQLRVEFELDPYVVVIAIANSAQVSSPGVDHGTGFILDIDVVHLNVGNDFVAQFKTHLDAAHDVEKNCFYALLSEDTLRECEPSYE